MLICLTIHTEGPLTPVLHWASANSILNARLAYDKSPHCGPGQRVHQPKLDSVPDKTYSLRGMLSRWPRGLSMISLAGGGAPDLGAYQMRHLGADGGSLGEAGII